MASIPTRPFPPSGDQLSIIGFGGIIVMKATHAEADRAVGEAIDGGVNYVDIAPSYGDAQDRLGPALAPYRDKVFLACKTTQRSAEEAERELHESLRVLQTEHFDLYQLHAITDVGKDVDAVFAKGGAMEVLVRAKKHGLIRHIGFSAHSVEAALEAMNRYDFDSVLFPINYTTFTRCNFGPQVLARAEEKGMARLALKAMARGKWAEADENREVYDKLWYEPVTEQRTVELALRWTLSRNVTAAIPPGDLALFRLAVQVAQNFRPLEPEEEAELKDRLGQPEPIFDSVA